MPANSVSVLVFTYKISAIITLIVISLFLLPFIFYVIFVEPGYIWLLSPLVGYIIYIQVADKAPFQARIIDKRVLTFSTEGIHYGEIFFPVSGIEAVAMYLYAFNNFKYRSAVDLRQNTYNIAPGDQNTISFRFKGAATDYSFYIDDYTSFCNIKIILNEWISQGINVVCKQAFDDDFMIQEMQRYNNISS